MKSDGTNTKSTTLPIMITKPVQYALGYCCSSGYTLSGSTCFKPITIDASFSPGYYKCEDNSTLSGTTCTIK